MKSADKRTNFIEHIHICIIKSNISDLLELNYIGIIIRSDKQFISYIFKCIEKCK